jgi:hypothetical protein
MTTNNNDCKQRLAKQGQTIAVRWKLKEGDGHQYFLAKVTSIDPAQKCFRVEYSGFTEASGERQGMIYMDDKENTLPWHTVDSRRSTSSERMKEVKEGDHLVLHHQEENEAPVLYEVIVEKVDPRAKKFTFFFVVFQETEDYAFRSMKKEIWHRIPTSYQFD